MIAYQYLVLVIVFGPNLMSWNSKKQSLIARSSTKVEYYALAHFTYKLLWLKLLLDELGIHLYTLMSLCDNLSVDLLSHNHVLNACTKHIEFYICFVWKMVVSKLHIQHVPTTAQIIYMLTKPLGTTVFQDLKSKLNVTFTSLHILKGEC